MVEVMDLADGHGSITDDDTVKAAKSKLVEMTQRVVDGVNNYDSVDSLLENTFYKR